MEAVGSSVSAHQLERAKTILMAGLPETGKTTFLAAFWHVVESGGTGGSLRLERLPPVRSYLESIRSSWLSLERQGRTLTPTFEDNRMLLCRPDDNQQFELVFPDLKGEIYEQMLLKRMWSREFQGLIDRVSSIALFINPDKVRPSPSIQEVNDLAQEIEDGATANTKSEAQPWDYALASTDIHVVDLLQLLVGGQTWRRVDRLAVIISAWDIVREQGVSPTELLRHRLPLLSQFLTSMQWSVRTNVFGVSAQGGDFQKDREHLAAIHRPEERVEVVDSSGLSLGANITTPILWMLD